MDLAALVIRRRAVVLLTVAALSALFVPAVLGLDTGWSVKSFIESERPDLARAGAHYGEFGEPDKLLLFGLPASDPFSAAAQQRLLELEQAMRALPGLEAVVTLASAPGFRGLAGEELRAKVARSRTWRRLLLAKDQDALGGIALLSRTWSSAERQAFFDRLRALPEARELRLAGIPFYRAEMVRMVARDQRAFLPLAISIGMALLVWLVPNLRLALATMLIVPFVLLATLGTMTLCGIGLTLFTSTLPTLLIAMAIADGVHMVLRFLEERRAGLAPPAAAAAALRRLWLPCLMVSATTALAFLSLTIADVTDLEHFAAFAALGVGFAWLFTVLVLPAVLSFIAAVPEPRRFDLPRRLAGLAARVTVAHARAVAGGALVLLLVAGGFALRVQQDSHLHDDYWHDSPMMRDLDWYEPRFLSMAPGEVLATAAAGITDPAANAELRRLVLWLEQQPGVDRTLSLVDLEADGLPSLLAGPAAIHGGLLSADGRTARILVFQEDRGNRYLAGFRAAVQEQGRTLTALDVRPAGIQLIATTLIDELTTDLGASFTSTVITIFLLASLLLRSLRLGLAAVLSGLMPLVVTLAFMAVVGLALRPLTVITFCISFGLADDDSVHLLARYREERARGLDAAAAVAATLRSTGPPVAITTLLLLVGFLSILVSDFRATFEFGLLTSFSLCGSLLSALFVLPSLLVVMSGRRR